MDVNIGLMVCLSENLKFEQSAMVGFWKSLKFGLVGRKWSEKSESARDNKFHHCPSHLKCQETLDHTNFLYRSLLLWQKTLITPVDCQIPKITPYDSPKNCGILTVNQRLLTKKKHQRLLTSMGFPCLWPQKSVAVPSFMLLTSETFHSPGAPHKDMSCSLRSGSAVCHLNPI